ncbi:MAG: response regulator [Candidatus Omnitrophica bacterium]|nr:response regulator [Candidatus Omnitrophota bacterium]
MKKILVVDDEPDVLRVMSFRLKNAGYEILTAANGRIAFDIISKERPDLVLLDLRMPVMDGCETCARIKNDEGLKEIIVILITASSGSKVAERAKELKADDYIIKPFDPDELISKVRKYIG